MTATLDAPRAPGLTIIRKDAWLPPKLDRDLRDWSPKSDLGRYFKDVVAEHLPAEIVTECMERFSKVWVLSSSLRLKAIYGEWAPRPLTEEDFGIVGDKVITDVGVGFLVDAWQNIVELEIMKYHGLGTGTTAENQTHTALVTELTTEYTGDVRATGSTTEGASANIFRTLGTNTLDGTPGAALREHGIFSASTVGVMWDRTLFSAITLSSGDGLASTYDMTASANG